MSRAARAPAGVRRSPDYLATAAAARAYLEKHLDRRAVWFALQHLGETARGSSDLEETWRRHAPGALRHAEQLAGVLPSLFPDKTRWGYPGAPFEHLVEELQGLVAMLRQHTAMMPEPRKGGLDRRRFLERLQGNLRYVSLPLPELRHVLAFAVAAGVEVPAPSPERMEAWKKARQRFEDAGGTTGVSRPKTVP